MAPPNPKPKTNDEYLAGVNASHRDILGKLRQTIHDAAPNAEECISYGMPAFRLNGRALVFFAAWANHCSFYPGSSAALKKIRSDSKRFQISKKGTIRFSPDNPLPVALVKKLVKVRIAQIDDKSSE
jgi:uncharacterized protein YdhG (YjbR/CyaY superfamily)